MAADRQLLLGQGYDPKIKTTPLDSVSFVMSEGELIVTQFTGPNRSQYLTSLFRLNDDSPKSDEAPKR